MPQRDITNNSIVNEFGGNTIAIPTTNNSVIANHNKSQITALLDSSTKVNYPKSNHITTIIISSSPTDIQHGNQMEERNNYPQKEEKNNNGLTVYTYTNKNMDVSSSPIAIRPPPPPMALNQFSFKPNPSNIYLSSSENVNAFFNHSKSSNQLEATISSYQSDQSAVLKDSKMGSSSLISPSSVHLLPQDNLYSQSFQPSVSANDLTSGIPTNNRLSSSFTYKNTLLANMNTGKVNGKSNVNFTKGIPISENTMIKSQRMHRKRTMRLTKQAQNEVSLYYNFDVNLLLQISVEQWVDFITITTFFLWQYPDLRPSATFMDDAYDMICDADTKERNYFFAYRRFLYQFMVKTSPNPFVVLYAIIYLFKLRESIPEAVVTPRSETFVFPVLIMIADKFIQDVHQLPAKYWAMAAKMNTDDLILFQRKIMKYLRYSLLINYDEVENVVALLDEFISREMELDAIRQDLSSPSSSSNSYPTPPISQQSSVDLGFSMFNDNIDSTNSLDNKEAEILIYTFRKVLNEQEEYLPAVYTTADIPMQYMPKPTSRMVDGRRYGEVDGGDGYNEGNYSYNPDSPAVISSYSFKDPLAVPGHPSSYTRLSTSAPKGNGFDHSVAAAAAGKVKRLSVGDTSTRSVSPYPSNLSYDSAYPNRHGINEPLNVYDSGNGKNSNHHHLLQHQKEDLEFKKYVNGNGKKISMLSKAMNLLKNDKNKNDKNKNKLKVTLTKTPSFTLPRNFKSSKFNKKSSSTGHVNTAAATTDNKDSPYPNFQNNNYAENQNQNYGSYFNSKRNSKSNIPQTHRYSVSTISNVSQNKRYSLPIYPTTTNDIIYGGGVSTANDIIFNGGASNTNDIIFNGGASNTNDIIFNGGASDTYYYNPQQATHSPKTSIINKKTDGSATPDEYLFKNNQLQNPGAILEYQKSPVKPQLIPKIVSTNDEFNPDIGYTANRSFNREINNDNLHRSYNNGEIINDDSNRSFNGEINNDNLHRSFNNGEINNDDINRSFDDTQGPISANVSYPQINRRQYEETEENGLIDYNQAVNMLKSIPFGDDFDDDIVVHDTGSDHSALKSKNSKTSFLFSKKKNHPKGSGGGSVQENGGGYVKKHNKSKSLFSLSSSNKKNTSATKKFYTLGHNRSENSFNNYFYEQDQYYGENYFPQEFDNPPPYLIEEEIEEEEEEEDGFNHHYENDNIPMNRVEEIRKSDSFPKRRGSNKSVKWLGKVMKTLNIKK